MSRSSEMSGGQKVGRVASGILMGLAVFAAGDSWFDHAAHGQHETDLGNYRESTREYNTAMNEILGALVLEVAAIGLWEYSRRGN